MKETPTLEELNDMFDQYQETLKQKELHLRLHYSFPTEDLDRVLELLNDNDILFS